MWEFFFLWWLYETELQEHLGCVNLCVCVSMCVCIPECVWEGIED